MKSNFLFVSVTVLASLVLSGPASAQDWAKAKLEKSRRHLEWITVKHDNREVKCFIAYPEVKEKATTVVVIHEIFGLSDWVRSLTDQLAAAGFIAIAPDLLSEGQTGTERFKSEDDVRTAIRSLAPKQIVADLNSTVDYVRKLPAANGKIAVAGFCWGGSRAWDFANANNGLKGTFVFYGTGPSDKAAVAEISAPVFGFYGENDARVNATIDATKKVMSESKKQFFPTVYKGAGHGFLRAGEAPDAKAADKIARKQAWQKFTKELRSL